MEWGDRAWVRWWLQGVERMGWGKKLGIWSGTRSKVKAGQPPVGEVLEFLETVPPVQGKMSSLTAGAAGWGQDLQGGDVTSAR